MKISDLITMCGRNLIRRKFRTALTIIGVVIGTCMIIVMISLGEGMQRYIDDMFNNFGDLTVIYAYPSWDGTKETMITDKDLSEIAALEKVAAVSPFERINQNTKMYSGKKDRYEMNWVNLVGVYPEALEHFNYSVKEGSMIGTKPSKDSVDLLFGSSVAYEFIDTKRRGSKQYAYEGVDEFGNELLPFVNPLKDEIILRLTSYNEKEKDLDYPVKVSGILEGGGSGSYETMYYIFIDVRKMKEMSAEYNKLNNIKVDKDNEKGYSNIRVKATTLDNVQEVQDYLDSLGYGTYSLNSQREEAMEQIRQMQIILGAIGAISLLVATISIANTMVMSVYERTREIGVMKVLGCLVSNIRTIFLTEAGMIGFGGGVMGIGISYVLSFIINNFAGGMSGGGRGGIGGMFGYGMGGGMQISIISPWMVGLGLIFSTFIGLIAGFYPAYRAVKISALEAIKTE